MAHRHNTGQSFPPKHRRPSNVSRDLTEYLLTHHAQVRAAQRNLSWADLQYVLLYGRLYYVAESITFFLGRRDIPKEDQANDMMLRLEGTAVVTASAEDSIIITTWRNRNGTKNIRRKLR